jgi:hypothetical protein
MRGKLSKGENNYTEVTGRITHGTRLVWNSFRSTFKDPSKRREAVIEETTCAISLFKLVKLGEVMLRFFLQMS